MQDKQKSTLYLPPELHQKLKIRAAVETQPMSAIAERAIHFYLSHPEVIDQVEGEQGHLHQVYICPECSSALVMRDDDLVSLRDQPGILLEGEATEQPGEADEQVLVSC